MPLLSFGYTEDELQQARWAVAQALLQALSRAATHPVTRDWLSGLLFTLPRTDPLARAETLGTALIQALDQRTDQALTQAQTLTDLYTQLAHLRQVLAQIQASPFPAQVAQLTGERDQARTLAAERAARIQALETQLAAAHQEHAAAVAHLQAELAALRRLLVAERRRAEDAGEMKR